MAKGVSSLGLFLYLLLLLIVSSSGTLVGFLYDARKSNAVPSASETIVSLNQNQSHQSQIRVLVEDCRVLNSISNRDLIIDLYLNKSLVLNLRKHKHSAISWLKFCLETSTPRVKIKNVIVSSIKSNDLSMLLSNLKSIHAILGDFHLESEVKMSLSIPFSCFENLKRNNGRYLSKAFDFINRTRSFVVIETKIDGELSMGDHFVGSLIKRTSLASSVLHNVNASLVLIVKSSVIPSDEEVAEFSSKILKSLKNESSISRNKIVGLFAEVSPRKDFERKELEREEEVMFHASHRELINTFKIKSTQHDLVYPPTTTFPVTPITNPATTPVTFPPENAAPAIITVPGMNPVNVTPNPPSSSVPLPDTDPVGSPVPITTPVTTPNVNPGGQPVTNPVTTFPAPTIGVPVATPVTTPFMPPATGNAPAVPGQSWCVAKSGASQSALQLALDYACGAGGADCLTIQQSGSCYNPNTLQNHASFAFNSYYQKNPGPTSCDFGGAAMITNVNPSTGSCIFPLLSTSTSPTPVIPVPVSPAPVNPAPVNPAPVNPAPVVPTPTTASNGPAAIPGSVSPPTVLNGSNPPPGIPIGFGEIPPAGFGESPPLVNGSTTSMSTSLQPFIRYMILVTSIIAGKLAHDM